MASQSNSRKNLQQKLIRVPSSESFGEAFVDNFSPRRASGAANDFAEIKNDNGNEHDSGRLYYLDWVRVTAIYVTVFYHLLDGLQWSGIFDHIDGFFALVNVFKCAALQFGMPMFFNISGRAQALTRPKSLIQTSFSRAKRLLFPFFICYVVLIPPWQWMSLEYDFDNPGFMHMKQSFHSWWYEYWTQGGWRANFDLAWLWFLPALFCITVLSQPLCLIAERCEVAKNAIFAVVLWVGLSYILKAYCEFSYYFLFWLLFQPASQTLLSRCISFDSDSQSILVVAMAVNLLLILIGQIGMVESFRFDKIDPINPHDKKSHDARAAIPFILLSTSTYLQGYFDQRWMAGLRRFKQDKWWMQFGKLVMAITLVITMCISSPRDLPEGHRYIYPIYSASYRHGSFFGALYVIGTWAYILVFLGLFRAYGNYAGSPFFHKHGTHSVMVVYIFHWLFVKMMAFFVVRPGLYYVGWLDAFTHPWMGFTAIFSCYIVTVVLSLAFYALLATKLPTVGSLFGI